MTRLASSLIACSSAFVFVNSAALAQDTATTETTVTDNGREYRFTIFGGGVHQFETDIDSGGDFDVSSLGAGAIFSHDFSEELSMGLQISYGLDMYDFSGTALTVVPPASPWDDIHTITAAAIFSYKLNNDWSIFGGPLFQSARESGADFGDSVTGGAAIGATYRVKPDFTIGGGVAIMSQLEDDPRIVPFLILNWGFADNFSVRNTSPTNAINRSGLELVYSANPHWEFAAGFASRFSRFRLDSDAPSPNGVGEDSSLPIWFRATYKASERCAIDGIIGVNADGELRLQSATGGLIASSDYDAGFFAGLFASLRF